MGGVIRSERNAGWIEQFCIVPEGKLVGQPVKLTAAQLSWLHDIYDSPTRRFILSMARKNGKTAFAACLLLLHLAGPEARRNSQLYSAAQSRDQAAILYSLAAKMVRLSPTLPQYIKPRENAKQLWCEQLGTLYRALSADATTAYGLSPAFVVHDELGQVRGPRSELYEALETAAGAQEAPLSLVISTQAPSSSSLLSMLIDDAAQAEDPETKVALYTADEAEDPFSEKAIRQANPNFDAIMNKKEVFAQAKSARRMPSSEAAYRNLVLNQRVNAENPFVSRAIWEHNSGQPADSAFVDCELSIGLDLSSRNDLTAFVVVAEQGGERHVDAHFFAPEQGLVDRAHRDRVPYDVWAKKGFLHTTPGATVDYGWVAAWIAEWAKDKRIGVVRFDRWRMDLFKAECDKIGLDLPLVPHGQGYKDMTPALDNLEAWLVSGKIRHGGHPVLTMCAANAVEIRDPAGNRKLDKTKASGRIDGMVALAMAMGAPVAKDASPDYPMFFL